MKLTRREARAIAKALDAKDMLHDRWWSGTQEALIEAAIRVILRAAAPAKPPGRTKRGKKGRAK